MANKEKVIKGLECCLPAHDPDCNLCPYDDIDLRCRAKLRDDIIALLKAQEPYRKGYWIYPLTNDCSCSECGNQPDHEPGGSIPLYDYCPYCGAEMEVKWK